ncbi:MAG: UbiA family prenyltransferase, partial [Desulfobacterales bacterium]
KVFRTLENMPYQHPGNLRALLFKIQRNLLLTNIYVALGAGSLCYANTRLLGIADYRPHMLISILYVLSMHILNHLIGQKADMYNDPDRALFYQRYKLPLSLLATVAGASGLVTAFALGLSPFIILLCMSLLGLSYNLTFVPKRMKRIRFRRLRDIPGSKTVLIALAWGIVTSALPQLSGSPIFGIKAVIVFIWATGMVFVRTAFFDILDMQGDRIIGKETIPILVGEKSAMRHLVIALVIIVAVLMGSAFFQLIPALGFALIICPVFMFIILFIYQRDHMLPGIRLEFLVESNFILAGILTFLWCMVLPIN